MSASASVDLGFMEQWNGLGYLCGRVSEINEMSIWHLRYNAVCHLYVGLYTVATVVPQRLDGESM